MTDNVASEPLSGDNVQPKLSIVIPYLNEGIQLSMMLKLSSALLHFPCEILVMTDNLNQQEISNDIDKLRNPAVKIRSVAKEVNCNLHRALSLALEQAQAELVLIFAADEVGPILAIEAMLKLMDEGCDMVSCTRYAHGGRRLGGSWLASLLSKLANMSFQLLAASALTDSTTGVKLFRKELFQKLDLTAKPVGWALAFEMAIKVQKMGLTLGEVPIISIDRLYGGRSRFNLFTWSFEYLRWFLWGCWTLRRTPGRSLASDTKISEGSLSVLLR
ncbi:MAG: glycosyltransferase [Planctomycetota bacterium]|nr:glycosyltransferase [Planctomycetota bacterium]